MLDSNGKHSGWRHSTKASFDIEKFSTLPSRPLSIFSTNTAASSILSKNILTSKRDIESMVANCELAEQVSHSLYYSIRWSWLSVYRRIFGLVFILNLGALTFLLYQSQGLNRLTVASTSSAASVNLVASTIVRHEHVVNGLFHLSCSLRSWAPLFIRRLMAKVYCYGGLHSGCSVAAVLWYILFTVVASQHLYQPPILDPMVAALAYFILLLFLCLLLFAHPALRSRVHNTFESTHRFGGWFVIALLWVQTMLIAKGTSRGGQRGYMAELSRSPNFWCLLTVTIMIVYPWVRTRRRDFVIMDRSEHAMRIYFRHYTPPWGSTLRLSHSPLVENHAFAVIPEARGTQGFSMLISDAGDWTKALIAHPPTHLWIKGAPVLGVIRIAQIFQPVLIVATGSGIGPCLSFFRGCPGHSCKVLWSTPSPIESFGAEVVNEVMQADPRAVIIDTRQAGRPSLLKLAYQMYMELKIEAVVVISNAKVTKSLVYELEARQIPTYAPIFDS